MSQQIRGHVCAFNGCMSASKRKELNISFFRFPKNPARCKLWVEGCKRPDLENKKVETLYNYYRVCSKHFRESMFLNDLKNRLQPHACPLDLDNRPEASAELNNAAIVEYLPNLLTGASLISKNTEKPITADKTPPPPENIENEEISQENPETHALLQDSQQSENTDATVINANVCLFCTKSAKKWKGQIQKLCDLDVVSLKVAIEPFLSFVSDTEIFNKLQEVQGSTILKAHRICRKDYVNSLQSFVEKPQTTYHKNIQFHKEGFENICQFIDNNIISKKKCYFFTYLCDFYEGSIKDAARKYGHVYNNILSKANFESKIRKHYEGQLKFSIFHNKKIIGPINREIDENLYSLLEDKSILHSAALILRRKILDIEKQTLPEEIKTADLLKGECNIPETLKDFYLTVLAGCHSKRRKSFDSYRLSNSLAADLVYNVSKGEFDEAIVIKKEPEPIEVEANQGGCSYSLDSHEITVKLEVNDPSTLSANVKSETYNLEYNESDNLEESDNFVIETTPLSQFKLIQLAEEIILLSSSRKHNDVIIKLAEEKLKQVIDLLK